MKDDQKVWHGSMNMLSKYPWVPWVSHSFSHQSLTCTSSTDWNGCFALEQKRVCNLPIHVPLEVSYPASSHRSKMNWTISHVFCASPSCLRAQIRARVGAQRLVCAHGLVCVKRSGTGGNGCIYIMHRECIFSWPKPLMQQKPPSLSPSSFLFIFPIDSKKKKKKTSLPIFVPTLQTHPLVHLWRRHRDLTAALCRSCRGFAKSCQLCFAAGSQTRS